MKKYKLKKDFSFLKAGNEVFLDFDCRKGKEFVEVYTLKSTYIGNMEVLKDTTSEFFEKIPEKPKSVWDLEGGDYYFSIQDLIVDNCIIYNYEVMNQLRELGDVFLTREEAEKEFERRKEIQKIKKYCWENSINMNNSFESQTFYSNSITGNIEYTCNFKNGNPIGYFSLKDAEKILEKFEEELKIILDV
ncbi:hypothetical protein DLH72_01270 [Candidatus Gracilibacteria bacterium]|nr:MAG: hypothetical protein DLH72_01270 [Candidatus Gracilibacteria bacterium]